MARKRRGQRPDLKEVADVSLPQKIVDLEAAERAWLEETKKAKPLDKRARERKIPEGKNISAAEKLVQKKISLEFRQEAALAKFHKIDLHGLSEIKAWEFLEKRIPEMVNLGVKEILLITGKGGENAVLRKIVPRWLLESNLKKYVAQIKKAEQKQGGEGALVVRLR